MKNLFYGIICLGTSIALTSCTTDNDIDTATPSISADYTISNPPITVNPPPPINHGDDDIDKDRGKK